MKWVHDMRLSEMVVLSERFRVECSMPVWAMEMIAGRHPVLDAWIVKPEFVPQHGSITLKGRLVQQ
jgi:hypothetical protein